MEAVKEIVEEAREKLDLLLDDRSIPVDIYRRLLDELIADLRGRRGALEEEEEREMA